MNTALLLFPYYYFPSDCGSEKIIYVMMRESKWWHGTPQLQSNKSADYNSDAYCGICCNSNRAQWNGMDAWVVLAAIGNIEM